MHLKKYDNGAKVEKAQRLEIVYEIKKKLDDAEIYTSLEVEKFKKALYEESQCDENSKDEFCKKLYLSIDKPVSIWQGNYDCKTPENIYILFQKC